MSQIAGRCWIPKDFFFLWDRLHGEVTRRSLHYPVWASPDSSSAPSSSHQHVPGRPLYPRWFRNQESNSWQWAQLTETEPPNHGGCDNFSPNVCIYTPEHVKISKESKFEISKNWPCQESNPGHQSHSQVIIPLDHWHIYRNIKSENINLIWLLVFSHRDKTSKRRLQLSGLLDLVDFLSEIKNFKLVFKIW